jgi:hypothetical protein
MHPDYLLSNIEPGPLVFAVNGKPIVTFHRDRRIEIAGDVRVAARVFWDLVAEHAERNGWHEFREAS